MQLKKGNNATIVFKEIKDSDGNIITNLSTAAEVYFMIKQNEIDADIDAKLSKSLTGGGITVDDPEVGSVTVVVESGDTDNIDAGIYFMALQIVYSAMNQNEINITENNKVIRTIEIEQDIIRG